MNPIQTTSASMSARAIRLAVVGLVGASTLWMAGCSSVKLDDKAPPIESRNVSGSTGTSSSSNAASTVAPVVAADADAGANAALSGLPRVIYFDFDSFVVKDEFRPVLDGYGKVLTTIRSKKLFIEGHTDERGGREYNLALGQKRAEAVVKSLTLLGVSADQVEAVSFGEERPAVTGSTEEAWAKNRRAEFKDR
ncbi:peptidoglycan-associated lipoprotein Pal [Aquabacterium sp. CECT 9606]|uniref:peptidoglycan-associated lipoprotein Pal n=1 Tax=Aquabacterium sp. CECT 9606 TaxID=2845822 RepID=UPI001EF9BAA4|nr:Peptidoglycan-associated lipoprotein [Aquabacterium sp. CECT 9606]